MPLSPKTLVRALIAGLALLAIALAGVSYLPASILAPIVGVWANRPPDATPLPPTLNAPKGSLPGGVVGLKEWAKYDLNNYRPVGSGFLLQLPNGPVIGVTTVHSVGDIGDPSNLLESIAFQIAGEAAGEDVFQSDTLYTVPGVPRTGDDLSVDYVFLQVPQSIDPSLALPPDPRGLPQPGERVSLFSGLGDGAGGRRIIGGTVQTADPKAVWVLMDPMEDPGGMSGSPLLSNYTGKVVGMAIATLSRGDRYLIGFHPIGSLLEKAQTAQPIKINAYSR